LFVYALGVAVAVAVLENLYRAVLVVVMKWAVQVVAAAQE
jgi:hypothetical protein